MTRLVRITGFLMIALGAVLLTAWLIEPLRFIWPAVRNLPLAVRIGLAAAVLGFLLLLGTVIWERMEQRDAEGNLLDEP